MSRIADAFAALQPSGRAALIPYVTAGDPHIDATLQIMRGMVEAGADIIELGIPFSDPMADGPVIQQACERALAGGTRLVDVIELVARFREENGHTAVVLMGYMNPIEVMGAQDFAARAAAAGVDGVLTVDLPPEEGAEMVAALRANGLDPIFLLAPTTSAERIGRVAAAGSGYIYYVSLKGVTGAASLDTAAVAAKLAEIREHTDLPLGVGFGIHDAASAAQVASVADAVVVGSALVKRVAAAGEGSAAAASVAELLGEMRRAMDAATGGSSSKP